MNILITLTVLVMANHLVMAETKEPTKDVHPKSGVNVKVPPKKPPANQESTSTTVPTKDPPTNNDPKPNNLWMYNPSSQSGETGSNKSSWYKCSISCMGGHGDARSMERSNALRGMPPPDDGSNCNHWYAERGAKDVAPVILRPHISRTRIAKAHMPGIDPYFNKGYFEPFEKRPKPVTLVTFRKNGLIPRQNIEVHPHNLKLEIAEMQSPYNNIGSFWQDDIGQS